MLITFSLGCSIALFNLKGEIPVLLRTLAITASILAFAQPSDSWAQNDQIKVSVTHSGEDATGKQFAYAIREAIRGSRGLSLSIPEDSGVQVRVITIDPSDRASGSVWTVASVVLTMANFMTLKKGEPQTWYPIYLTSHAMTVGQQRVDDQAKSVVASVDVAIERYRRDTRE